ncbi:MAG: hypothetical protein M3308_01910 [Actinomycetota bacterium]|nr:hypothetical protein [Actinomycetota bacterium]
MTEARVRLGELLDTVTARHDVVFVGRASRWPWWCPSRTGRRRVVDGPTGGRGRT